MPEVVAVGAAVPVGCTSTSHWLVLPIVQEIVALVPVIAVAEIPDGIEQVAVVNVLIFDQRLTSVVEQTALTYALYDVALLRFEAVKLFVFEVTPVLVAVGATLVAG